MSASVTWPGLAELEAQLRALPADLVDEASPIVQSHALAATEAIRTAYGSHRRSGQLADGVSYTLTHNSRFGVRAVVKSAAPEAGWFERGTQVRHTKLGTELGSMPATPTFIPAVERHRHAMYDALAELVRGHGLTVTGDA